MMDYKKIIRSRKLRIAILSLLDFVPDSLMVRLQYYIKTGRVLDLKNPKRLTEKWQWYKLNYRNPLMSQCVDKYSVRSYVESKGLGNILVPLIGVYDNVDDIVFSALPLSFVIKDTLGGGGCSVILVKDKNELDKEKTKKTLNSWLETDYKHKNAGREWVYDNKPHRIVIEEMLEAENQNFGINDYKFFCFNGKVRFIYFITERTLGKNARIGILDSDFNKLDISRNDELPLEYQPEKPANFDELIKTAEILSKDFPHVRVDLYNEFGKIQFGELTFFDGSGYMTFNPDSADFELGKYLDINN